MVHTVTHSGTRKEWGVWKGVQTMGEGTASSPQAPHQMAVSAAAGGPPPPPEMHAELARIDCGPSLRHGKRQERLVTDPYVPCGT